jgi:hypothetical protein
LKFLFGPIVNFLDVNKVAQLLFMPDSAHPLACHKDISETPLIVVRPLITNLLAGVEEAGMLPGRAVRGMVEFRHHQTVGTVAADSYQRILDHNPHNHDGPD